MGLGNFAFLIDIDQILPIVVLYIGPESILPLTTALAAVAGFLLMFWQRFIGLIGKIWRLLLRKHD